MSTTGGRIINKEGLTSKSSKPLKVTVSKELNLSKLARPGSLTAAIDKILFVQPKLSGDLSWDEFSTLTLNLQKKIKDKSFSFSSSNETNVFEQKVVEEAIFILLNSYFNGVDFPYLKFTKNSVVNLKQLVFPFYKEGSKLSFVSGNQLSYDSNDILHKDLIQTLKNENICPDLLELITQFLTQNNLTVQVEGILEGKICDSHLFSFLFDLALAGMDAFMFNLKKNQLGVYSELIEAKEGVRKKLTNAKTKKWNDPGHDLHVNWLDLVKKYESYGDDIVICYERVHNNFFFAVSAPADLKLWLTSQIKGFVSESAWDLRINSEVDIRVEWANFFGSSITTSKSLVKGDDSKRVYSVRGSSFVMDFDLPGVTKLLIENKFAVKKGDAILAFGNPKLMRLSYYQILKRFNMISKSLFEYFYVCSNTQELFFILSLVRKSFVLTVKRKLGETSQKKAQAHIAHQASENGFELWAPPTHTFLRPTFSHRMRFLENNHNFHSKHPFFFITLYQ